VGEIGFARTFGARRAGAGARPSNRLWRRLRRGRPDSKAVFSTIARRLVERGWVSVYFNPDTLRPDTDDPITRRFHLRTARLAMKEPGTYQGIPVHDRFVDYRLSQARALPADRWRRLAEQRLALSRLTFAFIVTAGAQTDPDPPHDPEHFGHCATLVGRKVLEAHYKRGPGDTKLFDDNHELEGWSWGSGLLVIPRGQWAP